MVALLGSAVFLVLSLPLPFLLGPMFACLIAAVLQLPLQGVPVISSAMRTVLGVAVGASITPDLFERLGVMAGSVLLVPPFVLLVGLVGYPYFRKLCGFDRATAYYSAMPGGLQDMVIFGEEAGANPRALSLVHATRVLVIISLMSAFITYHWNMKLPVASGVAANAIPLPEMLVMLVCAGAGWKGGERLHLFGASILGPLSLAMIASLTGLIQHRPPMESILMAQFFIGLGVGVHYVGITMQEIRHVVLAAAGYCLILGLLSVAVARLAFSLGVAPQLETLLAFAPGGQGEMVVLAIIAGADMPYVVTHHLLRMVVVIVGAPLVARIVKPTADT